MNSINVNIPVVNMPQVTQHQADTQRAPMVHQVQSEEQMRDRLDLQTRVAQEAKEAEGKLIDPNDKREEGRKQKKKNQEGGEADGDEEEHGAPPAAVKLTDSGRIIDLEA